jgi:hypothetical protein
MAPRPEDLSAAVRADAVTGPYAQAVERFARPSIRLRPDPEADQYVGQSRVGGWPDAPVGFVWPTRTAHVPAPSPEWMSSYPFGARPLQADGVSPFWFVAQIDLAAVAPFDTDGLLPDSGSLLFFYDDAEEDLDPTVWRPGSWTISEVEQVRVIHAPAATELVPCRDGRYGADAFPLVPSADLTLPSIDALVLAESSEPETETVGRVVLPPDVWHRLAELEYEHRANADIDQMLGWADNGAHGPSLPPDTNGRWADMSVTDRLTESLDARLLLQLSPATYEPPGFRFGRTLYFYVRDSDLQRGDFSQAWCDSD